MSLLCEQVDKTWRPEVLALRGPLGGPYKNAHYIWPKFFKFAFEKFIQLKWLLALNIN